MGLIERALNAVQLQTLHMGDGFCKKVPNYALMCHSFMKLQFRKQLHDSKFLK